MRLTFGCWSALLLIVLFGLSACGNGEDEGTPIVAASTRTLRPPTETPIPEAFMPTPTPTNFPDPLSLSPVMTPIRAGEIPASVQALIRLTEDDLVQNHRVDAADIRLLSVEAFDWPDDDWNCGTFSGAEESRTATAGYRILYNVGSRVFAYHTDSDSTFFLCRDRIWLALEGSPIPLDPIALSMIDLTARDAAEMLGVPQDSLRLTSLLNVNWIDSSLGCPKPTGVYTDEATAGWRIVFRTVSDSAIYHTSDRKFVHCMPEEEILPGMLRQALPRATAEPTPGT